MNNLNDFKRWSEAINTVTHNLSNLRETLMDRGSDFWSVLTEDQINLLIRIRQNNGIAWDGSVPLRMFCADLVDLGLVNVKAHGDQIWKAHLTPACAHLMNHVNWRNYLTRVRNGE